MTKGLESPSAQSTDVTRLYISSVLPYFFILSQSWLVKSKESNSARVNVTISEEGVGNRMTGEIEG